MKSLHDQEDKDHHSFHEYRKHQGDLFNMQLEAFQREHTRRAEEHAQQQLRRDAAFEQRAIKEKVAVLTLSAKKRALARASIRPVWTFLFKLFLQLGSSLLIPPENYLFLRAKIHVPPSPPPYLFSNNSL